MIKEHDRVVLKTNIPKEKLEAGDVGTVVQVYRKGEAFEVEFLTLDGDTVSVTAVPACQVRPVSNQDITHARPRKIAEGYLLPAIECLLRLLRRTSACYGLNYVLDKKCKGGPCVSEFYVIFCLIVGIVWITVIQYPLLVGLVWTALGVFIAFYRPYEIFLFSCCWLIIDRGPVESNRRSLVLFLLNLIEVGVFFTIAFLLLDWFDSVRSPWSALFASLSAVLTLVPLTDVKQASVVKWFTLAEIGIVWLLIVLIIGNVIGSINRGEKTRSE